MKPLLLIAGLLGSAFFFRDRIPGFSAAPVAAPATTYYGDGQKKSSAEVVNGLRHGPSEQWYPNGRKECEGEYRDGLREGRWIFWTEGGSLDPTRSGSYRAGKRVGD